MTTCPNCGHEISDTDDICPNCGFNLKKYRDDFFTDQHKQAKYEQPDEGKKIASRAAYREEFYPEKQNSTVQRMIAWIRQNATIVFLLGVFLLILMSFSRAAGWICFLALMVWLFIVCDRKDKVEQYTADKRLTEKINQVGSNIFNRVDEREDKVRTRSKEFAEKHPKVENQVREIKKATQSPLQLCSTICNLDGFDQFDRFIHRLWCFRFGCKLYTKDVHFECDLQFGWSTFINQFTSSAYFVHCMATSVVVPNLHHLQRFEEYEKQSDFGIYFVTN